MFIFTVFINVRCQPGVGFKRLNLSMQTFKKLLLQSINNLQLLNKLLAEEKEFLQKPDATPEALEVLTARKNESLNRIQQDIDLRKTFLESQGFAANLEGVEGFLARLPAEESRSMRRGWNQLVKVLEEVQKTNLMNGRLINRATQHFDVLLNTFQTAQNKVKVYNPAGSSGNLNTLGNLGKA